VAEYDPLDPETWPEEQRAFAGEVWRGLHDGDLKPLASYLRAGHQLDSALAVEIADAIDCQDVGTFHVVAKGRGRGQRGLTQIFRDHDRKMQIGVFMEDRISRYGKGGYDAALTETFEAFGIASSATVEKARKYVRQYIDKTPFVPGRDPWEVLKAVYEFHFTP